MISSRSLIVVFLLIASLSVAVFYVLSRLALTPPTQPPARASDNQARVVTKAELEVGKPIPESDAQEPKAAALTLKNSYVGQVNLIMPVSGVKRDQLLDTFSDARSEGRVHDAIDIAAPLNTAVLACADGQIVKLFQSERGGITIYQASNDKKLIFYYAHLASYAAGIQEGQQVRQGETIAYVGDTGNAGPGNFHLHFSIAVVSDPRRYWEGTNINPYPLLHH